MKKILSIIIAVLLLTTLVACGNNLQEETKGTQTITEDQKESTESTSKAETETASKESSSETAAEPESATPDLAAHSNAENNFAE